MKLKLKWLSRLHNKSVKSKLINVNCTSLNDLSNDLLFEIFDYLSYDDILLSFSNLNNCFEQVISNYPHCIDLGYHKEYPNHIRSLKVSANNHLLLLFSFEYCQLICLRAIILGNLKPQEVLNVLNYIPFKELEYIYLGVCAIDRMHSRTKIISTVQSHVLGLSEYRLKECHLKEKFCIVIDDLPDKLFSLEHLQLTACENFFIISQLLSRTPNLKYLHISTTDIYENSLIPNKYNLTYLCVRPHRLCSVKELTRFLRTCCPNLKKLLVELYIYRSDQPSLLVNKHQWMTIFPYRLNYFHLKSIPNPSVHLTKLRDDDDQLRSPLKENLLLIFSDIQEHYCQIIIDAPLISAWTKHD